jgi:NTP pyrophosphatase (non-canonical NTP hydrolase)
LRSDADTPIQHLKERIAEFARERQWEQFHSPKNLSMAMAVEAAEVMELFQWKTEQETQDLRADPGLFRRVREEIADVAVYLLNLCNRLDIDLALAVLEKLSQNARKYPAGLAKGNATKYTELRAREKGLLTDAPAWHQLEFDLLRSAEREHGDRETIEIGPGT